MRSAQNASAAAKVSAVAHALATDFAPPAIGRTPPSGALYIEALKKSRIHQFEKIRWNIHMSGQSLNLIAKIVGH